MKNRYIDVKSVYNVVQAPTYIFISLYIYGILPVEMHCPGLAGLFFVFVNNAIFHYKFHMLQNSNVIDRIFIHSDNIGKFSFGE